MIEIGFFMSTHAPTVPYVDTTGTPDVPSSEAGLKIRMPRARTYQELARRVGRMIARNPGYVLAAAAMTGFISGRVVKRLLSPHGR